MIAAPHRILIVASLCVATLVGMVLRESAARAAGAEVLMAMEAVDPRSLLSGHYVIVSLNEIMSEGETCPDTLLNADNAWRWNTTTPLRWLALTPHQEHHRVLGVFETQAEAEQASGMVVRGNADCNAAVDNLEGPDQPAVIGATVGVDRFYINQSEAQRIEVILRERGDGEARVYAIVSVGEDHRARLKGLVVDGERMELTWR